MGLHLCHTWIMQLGAELRVSCSLASMLLINGLHFPIVFLFLLILRQFLAVALTGLALTA